MKEAFCKKCYMNYESLKKQVEGFSDFWLCTMLRFLRWKLHLQNLTRNVRWLLTWSEPDWIEIQQLELLVLGWELEENYLQSLSKKNNFYLPLHKGFAMA